MGQDDFTRPVQRISNLSETLSKLAAAPNGSTLDSVGASDDGSLLSDNVEVFQLNELPEDVGRRQPIQAIQHAQRAKNQRHKRQVPDAGEEKPKSLVDPRKYKTKLCRNWKATGACPYEHTCCYAHGDLETRTMQQNNNVLSSLGYFSGIMLLAMKDDKQGASKVARAVKKGSGTHKNVLALKQSEPSTVPAPSSPTVHSPYCLPDGPSFGTESSPGSPLVFPEAQMPTYSFRAEGYPKSPSFAPSYPTFDTAAHYENSVDQYGVLSGQYGPYKTPEPHSPLTPLHYASVDYPSYNGYSHDNPGYSQEAHQAAMEKHPAVRNLQSGDMSHKQLQKVLHDIMYSNQNGSKQRKPRKKQQPLAGHLGLAKQEASGEE